MTTIYRHNTYLQVQGTTGAVPSKTDNNTIIVQTKERTSECAQVCSSPMSTDLHAAEHLSSWFKP
eukprot:596030-Pelagomonas_calceolata.AAC.3